MTDVPAGVVLAPTATRIPAAGRGAVVVSGSHGGAYAGYLIARAGARASVLSDAGIGLDEAGVGSLALCQDLGMAAVAVAHDSARIGDAADLLARGRLSRVNQAAAQAGCAPGMTCREAVAHLVRAPVPARQPGPYAESRFDRGCNAHGLRIVCVDSISLVEPADAGQVVVSGSHGALVAGQHALAIAVDAVGAFYNDAGIGADDAGVSRLPVLDARGIAAATVAAASARIGDSRSTLDDGVVSRANERARALGIEPGMPASAAVDLIHGASTPGAHT